MSKRIVKNRDGLRLRSAPDINDDSNILLVMPFGQPVEVLSAPEGARFWEVETTINGETIRGFAGHKFLRESFSDAREALIAGAVKEWNFFVQGAGEEDEEAFFRRVGDYWQSVDESLDGRDTGTPWSAAFMSFIMRNAAGYPDFLFSTAHHVYIRDAKKQRVNNAENAPFWLFRLSEHKPQIGDLLCGWRPPGSAVTFDSIPSGFFPSHTDVVVAVNDTTVMTIGGNVEDSVDEKFFILNDDGFVKPQQKLFAIMRNNR